MKFYITVPEVENRNFTVTADSKEKAKQLVDDYLCSGEEEGVTETKYTETLLNALQDLVNVLEEHTQYDNSDEELSGEAIGVITCQKVIAFISEHDTTYSHTLEQDEWKIEADH